MKFLILFFSLVLSLATFSRARVVSTIPSVTEMIYFLEAEHLLVGVTPYCLFPKEAQSISHIGSSYALDYEAIVKLKPSIILLAPIKGSQSEENLGRLNLKFEHIPYQRFSDIKFGLEKLNRLLGLNKEEKIKNLFSSIVEQKQKKPLNILIIIGETFRGGNLLSVRAAGGETFYGDLIEKLGHRNILAKEKVQYPILNLEKLIKLNFDLILRLGDNQKKSGLIQDKWRQSYFKNRIKFILKSYAVVPGPRIVQLFKDLKVVLK